MPIDNSLANLTESEFIVATDGLADKDIATFSWIVNNTDHTRIPFNTRICSGSDVYSYRAEVMATISIAVFLIYAIEFKSVASLSTVIYTDSKSFLDGYKNLFIAKVLNHLLCLNSRYQNGSY